MARPWRVGFSLLGGRGVQNRRVHCGTIIQSVFGRIDAEGNLVDKVPCQIEVATLAPAAVAEALVRIEQARGEMEARDQAAIEAEKAAMSVPA